MASNAQRRAVSAVVARTTVAGQPHVVSVTQELATYPTDIIRPEHVSTPAGIARVLERLQQHSRSATQAARSLPCNGGVYFPNVSIPAGQGVVLPHGLGMDVTFMALDVRLPSGSSQAPTIVDLGQDAAKNRLTLGASSSAIADIWVFPRPSAVGTALTTTLSSAISAAAAALAPAAANGTMTANYSQPLIGASVTISFNQTGWCGVNVVFTVAGGGVYLATAVGSSSITATFLGLWYDAGQPVGATVTSGKLAYPGAAPASTSTVAGPAWHCAIDLDFTTLPTQSLAGDGSKTIAGKTWTKGNSTNDATAMAITNGTGLVITPASATDFAGTNTTTTAPFLWTSFSNLGLTALSWGSRVRVLASIGADNNAANFDGVRAGVSSLPVPGTGVDLCTNCYRGHVNNPAVHVFDVLVNNARIIDLASTANTATGKVMGFETQLYPQGVARSYVGPSLGAGAAFNVNALVPVMNQQPPTNGQLALTATAPLSMGVVLCAMRAGSGTSYQTTIQRVRVDYQ